MTAEQKAGVLKLRQSQRRPWHSPPHLDLEVELQYLVTAACYEHEGIIGKCSDGMTECEDELLKVVHELCSATYAWCVLPNHYHLLLKMERIKDVRHALALFHGPCFTGVHPIAGTVKTRPEGERFGSIVLSVL